MAEEVKETTMERTLIPTKEYLKTGCHIGAKFKTVGMKKYIFKKRPDKLKVMDINTIDGKIKATANFLAKFDAKDIVIVSRKQYGQTPVKKFSEAIGSNYVTGRFIPGLFTNPDTKKFCEPRVLMVTDPNTDNQSIKEAVDIKIPVIGLCSTDNNTDYLDIIIPMNNKGRQSLALVYWLLAREVLKARGDLKNDADFKEKIEDYEFPLEEVKAKEADQYREQRFDNRRRGYGRRDRY